MAKRAWAMARRLGVDAGGAEGELPLVGGLLGGEVEDVVAGGLHSGEGLAPRATAVARVA